MFRKPLIAAAVLGALIAAGCSSGTTASANSGEASKSASTILSDAKQAAQSASSVRVKGSVGQSGQTVTLNLQLNKQGDATGSVQAQGRTINVVKVGSQLYVKQGGSPYIKLPTGSSSASQLAGIFDKSALINQALKPKGTIKKAGTATVNGQDAVQLKDSSGQGTLFVANSTSHPYPLKISANKSSGSSGSIVFTDWNQTVVVKAPTGG
jgi:outer membrane murein-binding lipoprotein Lpp